MGKGHFPLWAAAVLLSVSTAVAQDEMAPAESTDPLGPLALRTRSTLQMFRLAWTPLPVTLPQGQISLGGTITWTNVWNYRPNEYLLDGEFTRVGTWILFGLTDQLQLGVEFGALARGGGFADPWIQGFHDMLAQPPVSRDKFPRNRLRFEFTREDGTMFRGDGRGGMAAEDGTVMAQGRVWNDPRIGISILAGGLLSLPVGDGPIRSSGLDGGGHCLVRQEISDFVFYAGGSGIAYAPARLGEVRLRRAGWTCLLAAEVRVTSRLSVIAQWTLTSGAAAAWDQLSQPSHELTVGVKHRWGDRVVLEFGLVENIIRFHNGPDIGVHLGIAFHP